MRKLIYVIMCLICSYTYGQLSDVHYLPPLRQAENNFINIVQQAIYLSTPVTTAFNVEIYRGTNTTPLTTISISNTIPATYNLPIQNNNITLVDDANTGVVLSNSGLRLVAPGGELFYVNYRGVSNSQGASLTTKGREARGTNFKWGGVPNYGTTINDASTALGILATEDGTTVTIDGYDPAVTFRQGNNDQGITANSLSIVLNAGQSYVLEAKTNVNNANVEGWLGANISSNKDIVISNGAINYSVDPGARGARDAGIDQPVPENMLGDEYIFIRGNGNNTREFALIIATQDNTDIFVNGSTTAFATIDSGEYEIINGSNYSGAGPGSNMRIETSNDSYAYQNIMGSTANNTSGLNFVAPVDCLLPNQVNNIPNITDLAGTSITGGITIIASVSTPDTSIFVTDINGSSNSYTSNPVGSSDWKTFYIPNLTGNVSVSSSGPIAVGFFGQNNNRGVAGYFSGFDTPPNVDLRIAGSNCLPGAFLEIASGEVVDAYQWFDENGPIAGETSPTFSPTLAGDYFLRATDGPCTYDSNITSAYFCDVDIAINKTVDVETANEGDTVNYTIEIQSWGFDPVTNLVVTDILPNGLSLVSAVPSSGSWANPNWTIGTLNSGISESITITATVDDLDNIATQLITNTAVHTQDQVDTNISIDTPSASFIAFGDHDDDGILDINDLDDDNDGILDIDESDCNGVISGIIASNGTGNNNQINDGNFAANNGAVLNRVNEYLIADFGAVISAGSILRLTLWTAGATGNKTIRISQLPDATVDLGGGTNPLNINDTEVGIGAVVTTHYYLITEDTQYLQIHMTSRASGRIEITELNTCLTINTDGDGQADKYDADSDNDNCNDANEAYANANADSNNDGTIGGVLTTTDVNTNGLVIAAGINGAGDTYTTTPAISTASTAFTFQEAGAVPTISLAPTDQHVFLPDDGIFNLTSNSDTFQWQVSIDNGILFTNISDGAEYSGTTTDELIILSPDIANNGYLYRIILTNDNYVCGETISNVALLSVGPRTVITNRRITTRVKKQ